MSVVSRALGIALLAVGVAGIVTGIVEIGSGRVLTSNGASVDETKLVPVGGVTAVEVDGDAVQLHIFPTSGTEARVHVHGDAIARKLQFAVAVEGPQLRVQCFQNRDPWDWVPALFHGIGPLMLDIELPQQSYQRIEADIAAGTIELDGVAAANMSVKTAAGEIRASGTKGDLTAQTDTGQLVVDGSQGGLKLKTATGAIDVHLADLTGDVEATTNVGAVHVTVAHRPPQFSFHLRSQVGTVSADVPGAEYTVHEHTEAVGNVGTGGPSIRLTSDVGAVYLSVAGD